MELTVERGRGYVSSDAREGLPIGTIPVDAIFSPIPRVNYVSETTTDGEQAAKPSACSWKSGATAPLTSGEALSLAASALAQHSSLLANYSTPGRGEAMSLQPAAGSPSRPTWPKCPSRTWA